MTAKAVRSHVLEAGAIGALCWLMPRPMAVLILCGAYDVSRNRPLNAGVVDRYFFGNGLLTWLLSPLNVLTDLLALPHRNRGVYRLEDLPASHQAEIRRLLDAVHCEDVVGKLERRTEGLPRTMIFYKWYGANRDADIPIPAFHEPYRYVQTIGISVFNRRNSTSKHFGPFRATLRVLYNVNAMRDNSAYIVVGDRVNCWRDSRLFIFDDTLQHQSFNETDDVRYCLFVDILRPSPFTPALAGIVRGVRAVMGGMNSVFYKNWKVLKG